MRKAWNQKTKEQFILEARQIHGWKYDYSKVEYVNQDTKVCIVCPKHGEFWQTPLSHLSGHEGCKECCKFKLGRNIFKTQDDFICEANNIHNGKYDYSKVEYKGDKEKVCIICPKHGEFWQTPYNHLKGKGCPDCYGNRKLTTEQFIEKAKIIHGDKYDYSKVEYKNTDTKVCIICPEHGEFWQTPYKHIKRQQGCSKCKMSNLEKQVKIVLDERKLSYIYQANKKNLPWLEHQTIDFYLPKHKLAIECQGEQHFGPVDFAGKGEDWANVEYQKNIVRDDIKKIKCQTNNVNIEYVDFDKPINEQIYQILKKYEL